MYRSVNDYDLIVLCLIHVNYEFNNNNSWLLSIVPLYFKRDFDNLLMSISCIWFDDLIFKMLINPRLAVHSVFCLLNCGHLYKVKRLNILYDYIITYFMEAIVSWISTESENSAIFWQFSITHISKVGEPSSRWSNGQSLQLTTSK